MNTLVKPEEENTQISQKEVPSPDEVNLICIWLDRKEEVDSGLMTTIRTTEAGTSCIGFALEDVGHDRDHYQHLLKAKVYDVFGVSDIPVALGSFIDCINLITTSQSLVEKEPEVAKELFELTSRNVMSLFQELRPRDAFELMMVTKLIILNYMSNRELMAGTTIYHDERRTSTQNRGIKLTRLFLEIKDKLDKHRKPEQQIHVQHNHIYNEGQAIIGSQISTGGGK